MANLVDYNTDRGVALVTFNDPPVNSYTHEMLVDFDQCITDARFDDSVQVIVVTGHGEHFFSAGANIEMLRAVDPRFRHNFFIYAGETLSRLENTPKLVIAALNGHAVGGGLEVALACDLRVARQGEAKLGLPEIHLGLLPGAGGVQRLARVVGKGRAMQLVMEGSKLSIDEAQRWGLLNYVWDTETHGEFMQLVREYARRFTSPNMAAMAVGRLKRAVQAAYTSTLEQGVNMEREIQAHLCSSSDVEEGLLAWHEKRSPSFQGK